ncbi:MAG: hypothetical protein Pg6C_06080 [Treponemataceae bacterium]|nr:MAG: hypothetical protein Pg6C_06080 [Treponemataceae bacterium]
MNLGKGYKLNFFEKRYCRSCSERGVCKKDPYEKCCLASEKRTSKGGKTFPMPGAIDKAKPVILVEGEMDALSCAAIGIENVFAAGGTNGLTGPKVKQFGIIPSRIPD